MGIPEAVYSSMADAARQAAAAAYCPYSKFRVGAALLTDRDEIVSGCNVENASYGLTICAERNAVFQAVARTEGPLVIRAVLVYTPTPEPTAPCGACRQVINEFGPDATIVSICDGEGVIDSSIANLLPGAFGPGNLAS
jgi:cytidine deaminase